MLTHEQIQENINAIYKQGGTDDDIQAYLKAVKMGPAPAPKKRVDESVANFTGGKIIAQGLGQAWANSDSKIADKLTGTTGGVSSNMQKAQDTGINIQTQLLNKIKEGKRLGKDTSRLEQALRDQNQNIKTMGEQTGELLNQNKITGKQVAGDALKLATTIGSFGTYGPQTVAMRTGQLGKALPTAVQGITKNVGKGILQGAWKGFKSGATTGGLIGASTGVSSPLLNDKKPTVGGVVGSAATGALTGGAFGAVVGGISGGIQSAREKRLYDAVTPDTKDLSPTQYRKALKQGRISPETVTEPAKYVLSDTEKATAQKYKHLFTNSPVQTVKNISGEIANQDKAVGDYLSKNNNIFNKGELRNYLMNRLDEIDDVTIDEARLAKAKEKIIDGFISGMEKSNTKSLWEARKLFDQQSRIKQALSGAPTLQNQMKIEFRDAIQDFISERTDDVTYKGLMQEMSNLFRTQDTIFAKAVKTRGSSAIMAWLKANPAKAKVIYWALPSAIVGGLLARD